MHAGKCFGSRKDCPAPAAPGHSTPSSLPPQQMRRLLQSLGLPVRGEVLLTHPAQTSPPSQGFNPVTSMEAVSRAPRMGWESQAKILNAYSHSVPATQSARAGIEASVLPFPKPVNRDLPALKALEEWGGFFCSDVKLL